MRPHRAFGPIQASVTERLSRMQYLREESLGQLMFGMLKELSGRLHLKKALVAKEGNVISNLFRKPHFVRHDDH